jgi:hypothetical protein
MRYDSFHIPSSVPALLCFFGSACWFFLCTSCWLGGDLFFTIIFCCTKHEEGYIHYMLCWVIQGVSERAPTGSEEMERCRGYLVLGSFSSGTKRLCRDPISLVIHSIILLESGSKDPPHRKTEIEERDLYRECQDVYISQAQSGLVEELERDRRGQEA